MSYASLLPIEDIRLINRMNQTDQEFPQYQLEGILERHREETKGSQYEQPIHHIYKVDKHEYHVTFVYGEHQKTFTGKEWK